MSQSRSPRPSTRRGMAAVSNRPTTRLSGRRRRTMRVAAVLLIASALAAGCSSQPPPVAPPPSTPAGPTNTPLDAYRNYWQVTNASAANPTARDWSSDIALYTVDPLRSSDIATWRRFRDLGVVQQGTA